MPNDIDPAALRALTNLALELWTACPPDADGQIDCTREQFDALYAPFVVALNPPTVAALLDALAAAEARVAELEKLANRAVTALREQNDARREWSRESLHYRAARDEFDDAMRDLAWALTPAAQAVSVPPGQQALPLEPDEGVRCPQCGGDGWIYGDTPGDWQRVDCARCGGLGRVAAR